MDITTCLILDALILYEQVRKSKSNSFLVMHLIFADKFDSGLLGTNLLLKYKGMGLFAPIACVIQASNVSHSNRYEQGSGRLITSLYKDNAYRGSSRW